MSNDAFTLFRWSDFKDISTPVTQYFVILAKLEKGKLSYCIRITYIFNVKAWQPVAKVK